MKRYLLISYLLFCLMLFMPQVLMAQQDDTKKEADALLQAGIDNQQKGDNLKAEANFQKAITICRAKQLDQQLGYSLYHLSALYAETANYGTAIALGEEGLKILEKYPDREAVAKCLMNLEVCKKEHGDFIEAMSYADKAVAALRTIKNDKLLELALWRQGDLWKHWNSSRAIPMFKEALALAKKIPELHNLDNIYSSLGFCYNDNFYGEEVYDPAISEHYFLKALEAAQQYDLNEVAISRIYYAKICTTNQKYKEAEYHLKLVYAQASAANDTDMLSTAAFCLSEVYFGMKDYATAYQYLKKHEEYEDTYLEKQKKGTLDKMAFNFKTGRAEAKNKLLLQQRELQRVKLEQESFQKNVKIWSAIAIALFLFVIMILLTKYFRKKNVLLSKKSGTLRQQLLLTQMSPHFITSSINTIQSLIKEGKPDVAATYLSKFAKLTRQILENSTGQLISVEEEIAMITNYLTVQQLLHNDGFKFTIDADSIDPEAIYIPPMLTQPLLAIAVKRLMQASGYERSITVSFQLKYNKLSVEVQDTGGALKAGEKQEILGSSDVRITAERLSDTGQFRYDQVSIMDNVKNGHITGIIASFEVAYVED
jgi:tetratricopeptide (TPR) repeat protein